MIRRNGPRLEADKALCWWCHAPADGSPYRTPMQGTVGGRYVVCGPDCVQRPETTAPVFTVVLR